MTSLTALNLKIPEMLGHTGRAHGGEIHSSVVERAVVLPGLQCSWASVQDLPKC